MGKVRKSFAPHVVEQSVLDLACERVAHTFDLFDHVAVSFSGGKDSTVCLHLTLDEARRRDRLPLDVIFFDEEAIPYETEVYVRHVAQWPEVRLRWYCLPVKHRNACSQEQPFWWPWAPEARDLWVRPLPPEAITELAGFPPQPADARLSIPDLSGLLFHPKEHGRVGMILGIRAEESLRRAQNVLWNQIDNYINVLDTPTSRGNLSKVQPIYDWKAADVWTAPATFGWDYNDAYRLMDMAGVAVAEQRCSPPYGEEPLSRLWTYHVCFPDVWDRMAQRVPGAATAARYSRTELYSYRTRLAKPSEQTWQAYVQTLIDRHDESVRRQVARRIAYEIDFHYRQTSDPILDAAVHPQTGVSWRWLSTIAQRGDFKNRRLAHMQTQKDPARLLQRYREELSAAGAAAGDAHGNGHGATPATD